VDQHMRDQAVRVLEENVENTSRQGEWPVYEHYEITPDAAGNKYILAPLHWDDGRINRVIEYLHPLSRVSADLFLRFAGWAKEFGMDKDLNTERNARAALQWAATFGVLGFDPPDMDLTAMVNSQRVTADFLGMSWRGNVIVGCRNTAHGGPSETVESFAFAAWEAHIVWNLYASVRSQEIVDAPTVRRYMSTFDHGEPTMMGSWVEREIYSQDLELTRRWALTIVEEAVNRKIERYCYPTIQGNPGSYEQGWGFRSLLGAMWLQMMFLMRADRRCWSCGKPLDPGRRSHARYCDAKCRADWNYHQGEGTSSKEARRQARYVR
jgi:hypothetical protein